MGRAAEAGVARGLGARPPPGHIRGVTLPRPTSPTRHLRGTGQPPRRDGLARIALLLLMATVACSADTPRQASDAPSGQTITPAASVQELSTQVEQRIAAVPGAAVAVAYRSLTRPDSLFIHADTSFHAASTMKVPVMIEIMRRVDEGALRLDQGIPLHNEFASIVDGSPFSLDAGDDSDSTLYARIGSPVPLDELMELMITHSSNLATNVLIDLVGADSVRATATRLGAPGMSVLRGVEDDLAFQAGLSNTTSARALATLMGAIETGRAGSPAATTHMRDILLRQAFSDQIPAGLPPGTPVAHKTGSITATRHDAAIVYPEGRDPYVLVVLTGRIPDPAVARALTVDITRMVNAFDEARAGGAQ